MSENNFLALGKIVAGLSAIILVITGWLFVLMVDSLNRMQDRQESLVKSQASLETKVRHNRELIDANEMEYSEHNERWHFINP